MNGKFFAACLALAGFIASSPAADWPTYRHDNQRSGVTAEALAMPLAEGWTYQAHSAPAPGWDLPHTEPMAGILEMPRVRFDDAYHVVVGGDAVFFGSSADNQVYCLDAASGKVRWSFFTGGPIRLAPALWDNKVYFGSDDGFAYCLNAADGKVVWQRPVGPNDRRLLGHGKMISFWPIRTGLLLDNGIAYFGSGVYPSEGTYLEAVDAKTGKTVWRNDALSEGNISPTKAENKELNFSPQGYLLSTADLLFVPMGRAMPTWFNRKDGSMAGTANFGKHIGGTFALLSEGKLYTGTEEIIAVDPDENKIPQSWYQGRTVVMTPKTAYVATDTNIMAIDRAAHAKASAALFSAREKKTSLSTKLTTAQKEQHLINSNIERYELALVELDKKILAATQAKQDAEIKKLKAEQASLQASLKKEQAKQTANEKALAELQLLIAPSDLAINRQSVAKAVLWNLKAACRETLILAGNTVFAGGQGQVIAIDAATGKQLWTGKAQGKVRGLAVANGRLFASTDAGAVQAYAPGAGATAVVVPNPVTPPPADALAPAYVAAAERIVKDSGVKRGFCLVVGLETGRLAYEIAKRTELTIYAVDPDAAKVAAARKLLDAAGVYGARVSVDQGSLAALPYSDYFANLIVSERPLASGAIDASAAELLRMLKPIGGTLMLGQPAEAKGAGKPLSAEALRQWLAPSAFKEAKVTDNAGLWAKFVRGSLPGAGKWTHQYCEPGNTACSDDRIVKAPLGLLWFGSPGPGEMSDRHPRAVAPLSVNGVLFVPGQDSVMAYDAYNGLKLWDRQMPNVGRTGASQDASNLAADDDSFFVVEGDHCFRFDSLTGKVLTTFRLPPPPEAGSTRRWGYLAVINGLLYGSSCAVPRFTDQIFAYDIKSGMPAWVFNGINIPDTSITIGDNRIYFMDKGEKTAEATKTSSKKKTSKKKLTVPGVGDNEKNAQYFGITLDAMTGKQIWRRELDLTGCVNGVHWSSLATMYHNGVLMVFGVYTDGHFWKDFFSGQFDSRKVIALSGSDGKEMWSKNIAYRVRPLIVGDTFHAEPWAFKLSTGEQIKRTNPITGAEEPWQFARPGHHCGCPAACENVMFFRSYNIGYYDLTKDSGTVHFGSQRAGCWINFIFANGLVMVPEAGSGCMCAFPNMATVVFKPVEENRAWSRFSLSGGTLPVKQLSLNIGAPGDRRDSTGKLWLSYPRPIGSLVLPLEAKVTMYPDGAYFQSSADFRKITGTKDSWLYTFGARGLQSLSLPLRRATDGAARYTVRLSFAAVQNEQPGQRVFDVQLQDKTVLKGFDVGKDCGGLLNACVKEFKNIDVKQDLTINLVAPSATPVRDQMPILQAVEIVQEK